MNEKFSVFTSPNYKKSNRGFTLLEVMIATGILGCALVALLTSVNQSHKINKKAVALMEQSLLAETKMEEVLMIETLSSSTSGSGSFKNSALCTYSYSAEKTEFPFEEFQISSKTDELILVNVRIHDQRTPQVDYILSRYVIQKQY